MEEMMGSEPPKKDLEMRFLVRKLEKRLRRPIAIHYLLSCTAPFEVEVINSIEPVILPCTIWLIYLIKMKNFIASCATLSYF